MIVFSPNICIENEARHDSVEQKSRILLCIWQPFRVHGLLHYGFYQALTPERKEKNSYVLCVCFERSLNMRYSVYGAHTTNMLRMTALHLMARIICLMRTHTRSGTRGCNLTPPVLRTHNGAAAPVTKRMVLERKAYAENMYA